MENVNFLIKFLQLVEGIQNADKSVISENAEFINAYTLQDIQINQIKDYFKNSNENIEILSFAANKLNVFVNKDSFIKTMELRGNTKTSKEELKNLLSAEYNFDEQSDEYLFYSVIARRITNFSDPELLRTAIEKLQNI